MQTEPGDFVVGAMMVVFGFVGLFLAAGARDLEMTIFGWALVLFAVTFVFGLIKRRHDQADAAAHHPVPHEGGPS